MTVQANDRRKSDAALVHMYFVRHGQAGKDRSWHYEQAQMNMLGLPLSELGLQQAEAVAHYLSTVRFQHIYSSDLLRAYETAREIHNYHAQTPIHVIPDLREVHAEHLERVSVQEHLQQERQRVEHLAQTIRSYSAGESILLIGHGNIFRLLLALLAGTEPNQTMHVDMCNASVTRAIIDESGRLRIRESNNVSFLQADQVTYI